MDQINNFVSLKIFQSFIKEEPEDITSDIDEMDNVDPTQFLAQENDDEMEADKHPQILASLGLTHISQVSLNYKIFHSFPKCSKTIFCFQK